MIQGLGDLNLSLALAAMGSALGTGVAGMAVISRDRMTTSPIMRNILQCFILDTSPLNTFR